MDTINTGNRHSKGVLWAVLFSVFAFSGGSSAQAASSFVAHDYDGDGIADIAWRSAAEVRQYIVRSSDNVWDSVVLGLKRGDMPVSGDFDGDGVADIAVRRPSTQMWYVLNSSGLDPISQYDDAITRIRFGREERDIPVTADYDGDGRTDIAVRRPKSKMWYILNSSGTDSLTGYSDGISRLQFGLQEEDVPVPADYDGDGKADIAFWRATNNTWYIRNSSGQDELTNHSDGISRVQIGDSTSTYTPVTADFDGDGKTDIAVVRVLGLADNWDLEWTILNSGGQDLLGNRDDGVSVQRFCKTAAALPVPADYNGDGKADLACSTHEFTGTHWEFNNIEAYPAGFSNFAGLSNDFPLAGPFSHYFEADIDYDNLNYLEELDIGSDPTVTDTDGDGFDDGAEFDMGTDPNDPQSVFDMAMLNISDQNLNNCIRSHYAGYQQITNLDCSYRGISDLDGINGIPGLKVLQLMDNEVSDLSPLSEVTSLQVLYLDDNNVTDISPLENLLALRKLGLSVNLIDSLTSLFNLTSLERLFLGNIESIHCSEVEQVVAHLPETEISWERCAP